MKPRDAVLFDIRTIAALLALILSLLIIIFIKTLLIMRLIEL